MGRGRDHQFIESDHDLLTPASWSPIIPMNPILTASLPREETIQQRPPVSGAVEEDQFWGIGVPPRQALPQTMMERTPENTIIDLQMSAELEAMRVRLWDRITRLPVHLRAVSRRHLAWTESIETVHRQTGDFSFVFPLCVVEATGLYGQPEIWQPVVDAGVLLMLGTRLLETAIRTPVADRSILALSSHLVSEAWYRLQWLFASRDPFWEYARQCMTHVNETLAWEQLRAAQGITTIDEEDLARLARKFAVDHIPVVALTTLAGCPELRVRLERALDCYHLGLAMAGDIRNWRDDHSQAISTYLLTRATASLTTTRTLSEDDIARLLVAGPAAELTLDRVYTLIEEAVDYVGFIGGPTFRRILHHTMRRVELSNSWLRDARAKAEARQIGLLQQLVGLTT